MKTLKEALFNKKTLSSISEFDEFMDKGASELFDFIIDEKKELSEYVIISTKSLLAGVNGRVYGLVLCPSVEKLDEFVRNANNWPELKVNYSLIDYDDKEVDIIRQRFILVTICKKRATDNYSILDYGLYSYSKTGRNKFYKDAIIDDITVTKNIKNINDLKAVLK